MTPSELVLTRTIAASAQTLFEAWLDPHALARFMCPGDVTCKKVEVAPQISGSFLILMVAGDKEMPHQGEYRVIHPFECLEFTWRSMNTGGENSLVTLLFESLGQAQTKLTLRHVGLPTDASKKDHHAGWSSIMEKLSSFLS